MTKTDELAKRQKPFFLKIIFAFGILNFGHCDLFGIWDLCFGISGLSGLRLKWLKMRVWPPVKLIFVICCANFPISPKSRRWMAAAGPFSPCGVKSSKSMLPKMPPAKQPSAKDDRQRGFNCGWLRLLSLLSWMGCLVKGIRHQECGSWNAASSP